jgi:lipoprotein-releasing system ATP-binding protein
MSVVEARALTKTYTGGDGARITVLDSVDMAVERGEMVAVIGASGAGKSTLLHLLGALDRPTAGSVRVAGQELSGLGDDAVSALRNRTVGFVFQFHHLLREFTAIENVMTHRPSALSGGEQQRTAVARALAADPAVLLADEPSGNLDHMNSEKLHDLFAELARELEIAMVVVTHNRSLAARADRILYLEDARLTQIGLPEVVA